MKNTLDAIRYGLETLKVTPKEMFSLIESSKGYDGDNYSRWLANEIIKIAEKDEVGYSQLLAKWFNMIQSIIDEYADTSIKECFENKIKEMLGTGSIYTVGFSDSGNVYGKDLSDVDWGNKVDLPYNYEFIDNCLPSDIRESLLNGDKGNEVVFFLRLNSKDTLKKSYELLSDAKRNGVSIKNHDSLMLYRFCSIARALEDVGTKFKLVFMTNTEFLYNSDNADIIKYLLSFFKYSGFVVNSKDLYEGSFTSEEYAICACTVRDGLDDIQDGIVLPKATEVDGEVKISSSYKRYSRGTDMLASLFNKYGGEYPDKVPMIDKEGSVVGVCRGIKTAYGYLCKGISDRNILLTNYPLSNTKYIAITKGNLMSVIAYYGVSSSMDSSGLFSGIKDIIDGHPDYLNLVSNCVPIFLFDVNTKFKDLGVFTTKSGKEVKLRNHFNVCTSDIVKKLVDTSSVYFSYESKELMSFCMSIINSFISLNGNSVLSMTFEEIRQSSDNGNVNRDYLTALSRCKDYISSLYRQMM